MKKNQPVKSLEGIRVLDFGTYITAPYAAMLLAELGADVIKVERPDRADPFRNHTGDDRAPFFWAFNRNKRALCLDYTKAESQKALHELVKSADVLIINVRPGVEGKIGLDPNALQAINPRLIYCRITGFGADGPYSGKPAYDTVGQVLSGLLSRFHQTDDPRIVGPALSDSITGMNACIGILSALTERSRTDTGRLIDVNMLESTLTFAIEPLTHALLKGVDQSHYYRGAASQAYIVRCRDGLRIGLHMSSVDKFWRALTGAISRPDLAERYADRDERIACYDEIAQELAKDFATKDREEWIRLLEAADFPFVPERTLDEIHEDPQIAYLGTFEHTTVEEYGAERVPNRAIRFDGDNRSVFLPAPRVGAHSEDILREIGVTDAAITELRRCGQVR